jgi:DNA-binding MurR/RpiR family transcriptional regulator
MMSSPELAASVGVSQPSITRFAFALGYDGYQGFRRAIVAGILDSRSGRESVDSVASGSVVDAAANNVAALAKEVASDKSFADLILDLQKAPTIGVFGLRVGDVPARWFHFLAHKIHGDVRLIGDGATSAFDSICDIARNEASWIVAFVLPEYPAEAKRYLEMADAAGLSILLVTDSLTCPLTRLASTVITTPVLTDATFDSVAAPTVLGNVLAEAMIRTDPGYATERLEAFDVVAREFGLYLDADPG